MSAQDIAKALGLTPEVVDDTPKVSSVVSDDGNVDNLDADYRVARGNYYTILETGMVAVQDLAQFAKDVKTPQIYDSLTKLMKVLAEINGDLLALTDKRVQIRKVVSSKEDTETKDVTPTFIGSTTQLLQSRKSG